MPIFIADKTTAYYGNYSDLTEDNTQIGKAGLSTKLGANTFQMDGLGYTSGALVTTWSDTHTTVLNTKALRTIVNPQVLAVDNTLLVLDDVTTATCAVNIQADNTGNVGTHFGIDLTNTTNNNDFEIRNDPSYEGSVVFKDFGAGSGTTQTGIKQGTISLTDTATPLTTSFSPTTLTSGASSATWADIISGSAGSNTLQEVLTAGNSATNLNITLNNGGSGSTLSQMTLSPISSNIGAIENFTPVVPTTTAQSSISIGASSGNLGNTIFVQDTSVPQLLQTFGQIITVGDKINDPFNLKPELQLLSQFTDTMGIQTTDTKYQLSGITHQSASAYTIGSTANVGITSNNVILTSNNLTSTTDTLTVKSLSSGYTSSPNIIVENVLASAGNTTGVPSTKYYKSGRTTVLNDVIMSQQFNAKNYANVEKTYGKIECSITGASAITGDDGALDFYTLINGTNQNVLRLNGADNENNTFRPFDLNGNALKTSVGNLEINATSSTTTGQIVITPKAGQPVLIPSSADPTNDFIRINPQVTANTQQVLMTANNGAGFINSIDLTNAQFNPFVQLKADFGGAINKSITLNVNGNGSNPNSITSYDGQTNLPFQIISTGVTNGSIEFVPLDGTGDLIFTGTNLQSGSSGANSGQHLRIKLNGVYYKIRLEDD